MYQNRCMPFLDLSLWFVGALTKVEFLHRLIQKVHMTLTSLCILGLLMSGHSFCSQDHSSSLMWSYSLSSKWLFSTISVKIVNETTYALKTPHLIEKKHFWPGDLDLWPMTLTFKLDLDGLPLDLHTKMKVCTSVRSTTRARQTHT